MDLYTLMRQFADSWGLLALFGMFVAVVIWAFRPGSRSAHADVANIPFRHEDKPARADAETGATIKEARK